MKIQGIEISKEFAEQGVRCADAMIAVAKIQFPDV